MKRYETRPANRFAAPLIPWPALRALYDTNKAHGGGFDAATLRAAYDYRIDGLKVGDVKAELQRQGFARLDTQYKRRLPPHQKAVNAYRDNSPCRFLQLQRDRREARLALRDKSFLGVDFATEDTLTWRSPILALAVTKDAQGRLNSVTRAEYHEETEWAKNRHYPTSKTVSYRIVRYSLPTVAESYRGVLSETLATFSGRLRGLPDAAKEAGVELPEHVARACTAVRRAGVDGARRNKAATVTARLRA